VYTSTKFDSLEVAVSVFAVAILVTIYGFAVYSHLISGNGPRDLPKDLKH
jgi:hypothetical protein